MTNVDTPATFAATVTITGDADEARVDSGECVWAGAAHLVPGYVVSISAGSAVTTSSAPLRVESIEAHPDNGAGTCTYSAYFEAIAANQRSYELWVGNNVRQPSFTVDQLKDGPTYRLEGVGPRSDR
ncbi:hypothetical protein [Rhodococcus sp. ABRD24]|uniref:hypothetical protein n=1 Tax=Rhodococcus sp. ABRD24 TaxID=2507582 RepID=UPI001F609C24|nr:hypothetical protein [Rhodococcus sp. ABRD24]